MASDETIPKRLRGESDNDILAYGRVVWKWGARWETPAEDYPILRSFSVHPPKHRGDRWLVVLKGYDADGEIVAFHKGQSLLSAIAGALRRMLDGKADWRPETPYRDVRR